MNAQTQYTMPNNMIQSRLKLVQLIGAGYNNSEISRITGHSRGFIGKVRKELNDGTLMNQNVHIGRPTIKTPELIQKIDSITQQNRRMPSKTISNILKSTETLPSASYGTVNSILHELKYNYLPLIKTFEITEQQRVNRLAFYQQAYSWKNGLVKGHFL